MEAPSQKEMDAMSLDEIEREKRMAPLGSNAHEVLSDEYRRRKEQGEEIERGELQDETSIPDSYI